MKKFKIACAIIVNQKGDLLLTKSAEHSQIIKEYLKRNKELKKI